jgi:hypothetical protein
MTLFYPFLIEKHHVEAVFIILKDVVSIATDGKITIRWRGIEQFAMVWMAHS